MKKRFWIAAFTVSLLLAGHPAEAGPLSLLVKAAKVAGKAGKGAKVAKGAATAGKVAAGGLVAERAVTVFRLIPDDVGRVSAYVSRDGDVLRVATRADEPFEAGWAGAVDDLRARSPEPQPIELYLDPTAAAAPPPAPMEGVTLHAVDLSGEIHPVRWDGDHWAVELGEVSLDLVEFGTEQLGLLAPAAEEPDGPSELEAVAVGVGICVLGFFGYREWRKPSRRGPGQP